MTLEKFDELYTRLLKGKTGQEREDLLAGMKALNISNPEDRQALRESVRRAHPDWTDRQVEVFLEGRVENLGYSRPSSGDDKKALRESFKRMNPDWDEKQLDIAVEGR